MSVLVQTNYGVKLENFQVAARVWLPARSTVLFAASVNTSAVVETSDAFAEVMSTTFVYTPADALRLAAFPVPPVQDGAFHETSELAQVTLPPLGGVKLVLFGASSILSFLPSPKTMLVALTVCDVELVSEETSLTVNVTEDGTVTFACSLTVAVNVVVCDVSGRVTTPAHTLPAASIVHRIAIALFIPISFLSRAVVDFHKESPAASGAVWAATCGCLWLSIWHERVSGAD